MTRGSRIGAMLLVIGVILVGLRLTGGGEEPAATPRDAAPGVAAADPARDVAAMTLLQTAGTAVETVLAESGPEAVNPSALAAVEPNVGWVAGGTATSTAGQVAVTAAGGGYVLATTSVSGTPYTVGRDAAGVVTRTCGPGCSW